MQSLVSIAPALLSSAPTPGGLNASAGDLFARIWPTLLILLAIAVAGGIFAMWLRRRLASKDEGGAAGFTLEDLRRLHRSGEMSDVEFESAKAAMLANRPSRAEMAEKLVKPRGSRPRGGGVDRDNPPPQQRKR